MKIEKESVGSVPSNNADIENLNLKYIPIECGLQFLFALFAVPIIIRIL